MARGFPVGRGGWRLLKLEKGVRALIFIEKMVNGGVSRECDANESLIRLSPGNTVIPAKAGISGGKVTRSPPSRG
jgi:hypothetical protein